MQGASFSRPLTAPRRLGRLLPIDNTAGPCPYLPMTHARMTYVFNGDADGLCALQQLRLREPGQGSVLLTGVKRDIQLLKRVQAEPGDQLTVLDISLDSNRVELLALLERGVKVRYFDHHYAGEVPAHPGLQAHINTEPSVCTSILVDRYCESAFHGWAIAAAFGDNLSEVGQRMAAEAGLDEPATAALRDLGVYLNYNAYGEAVSDLHFDPAALAQAMLPYEDPLAFAKTSAAYAELAQGYAKDMALMRQLLPQDQTGHSLMELPDTPWAKRAVGSFANEWVSSRPGQALAILAPRSDGAYMATLRVPEHCAMDAATFCRQFESGGGRRLAAGVNHLDAQGVARFKALFAQIYSG